jgi:hypothetical protein
MPERNAVIGSTRVIGAALLLSLSTAAAATAQQANPMPAAVGMSDNHTAVARGYAAVAWNPANLGLAGGPNASATLGATYALAGLGPISLSDLHRYQDETVPLAVRQQWLADINRAGGQTGGVGADVTWAALQTGRFALQVSSSARALNDISPGLAELILFGNADEDGNPRDLQLGGSLIDAQAHSTGALSYAVRLPAPTGLSRLAIGITAKYTIGHVLAVSQESVGQATADPVSMRIAFPLAYTPVNYEGSKYWIRAGGGFGLDLGVAAQAGPWAFSAVGQNLVNTFEWDLDRLRYRPLDLVFSDTDTDATVDWQPMSEAPAEMRASVEAATFKPSLSVGAALRHSPRLLIAADARLGSADGMETRPPVHAGAGLEYRPLHWLPLQVGASWVRTGEDREGLQLGGGFGLQLGSFMVSASAGRRNAGLGTENLYMVSLLSHTF